MTKVFATYAKAMAYANKLYHTTGVIAAIVQKGAEWHVG